MVVELFVEITPNSARPTNKNWGLISRERKVYAQQLASAVAEDLA